MPKLLHAVLILAILLACSGQSAATELSVQVVFGHDVIATQVIHDILEDIVLG